MAVSPFKKAEQIVSRINNLPRGEIITEPDTGNSYYEDDVIPTAIDPHKAEIAAPTNPEYYQAREAIDFVERSLARADNLDYKLQNKTSADYDFLRKMVAYFGEKPS